MHWAERYVGQPYAPGANDCAGLAVRVQREIFGREIHLPDERPAGMRELSRHIELHQADFAERVNQPQEGDAVLMVGRGRLNHIGIYCEINGAPYVLHAMRDAGAVCLHRLRDLPDIGLPAEGFYRWKDSRRVL